MQELATLAVRRKRQWHVRGVLARLATILAMLALSVMLGCPDDGGGDFQGVEEEDIEGRAFESSNCAAFGIAGPCTIDVGTFVGEFAPITIETNPIATGTINVDEENLIDDASCLVEIDTSDFPPGEGPQVDDVLFFDPCTIDEEVDQLRLERGDLVSFFSPVF